MKAYHSKPSKSIIVVSSENKYPNKHVNSTHGRVVCTLLFKGSTATRTNRGFIMNKFNYLLLDNCD